CLVLISQRRVNESNFKSAEIILANTRLQLAEDPAGDRCAGQSGASSCRVKGYSPVGGSLCEDWERYPCRISRLYSAKSLPEPHCGPVLYDNAVQRLISGWAIATSGKQTAADGSNVAATLRVECFDYVPCQWNQAGALRDSRAARRRGYG